MSLIMAGLPDIGGVAPGEEFPDRVAERGAVFADSSHVPTAIRAGTMMRRS